MAAVTGQLQVISTLAGVDPEQGPKRNDMLTILEVLVTRAIGWKFRMSGYRVKSHLKSNFDERQAAYTSMIDRGHGDKVAEIFRSYKTGGSRHDKLEEALTYAEILVSE